MNEINPAQLKEEYAAQLGILQAILSASQRWNEILTLVVESEDVTMAQRRVAKLLGTDEVAAEAVLIMQVRSFTKAGIERVVKDIEHTQMVLSDLD